MNFACIQVLKLNALSSYVWLIFILTLIFATFYIILTTLKMTCFSRSFLHLGELMTFLSYQLVADIAFKSTFIKMELNSTTTKITLLEPFSGNLVTNLIASFAYVLSLGCSVFLIWFSWIEKSKYFSNFRPVTQQLLSFCLFQVSI